MEGGGSSLSRLVPHPADEARTPARSRGVPVENRDLRAADRLALFLFAYGSLTIAAVAVSLALPLDALRGGIPALFLWTLPELLREGRLDLLAVHALLVAYGVGMMLSGVVLGRKVVAETLRLEHGVAERALDRAA
jgi:hypothetical protein